MNMPLDQAIKEWTHVLGPGAVLTKKSDLFYYANDTTDKSPHPGAALKPASVQQVIDIVHVANKHKIGIYPISKGKNWGYGAACPVREGDVVIDLGGLNRIIEVNSELAYCVIEPGVTQQQLYDYLRTHKVPLWIDATGGPPSASLIGNALERGFGHTPYADHFQSICGMEVVLPNGELLKTGFGHFNPTRASVVNRYGIGPFLDGLFTQSNFGIVVRMGLWLMPAPACTVAVFGKIENDENLFRTVEALRILKLQGVIPGCSHIANDRRLLAMGEADPNDIKAWNFTFAFYGTPKEVAVKKQRISAAIKPYAKLSMITDSMIAIASRFPRLVGWVTGLNIQRTIKALTAIYGLLKGIPTEHALRGTYLKNSQPIPDKDLDVVRDNCGLFWIAPVLKTTKQDIVDFLALVRPIYKSHDFEFPITFNMSDGRSMCAILSISFNKDDAEESTRAKRCYEALFAALIGAGFIPYRTGISSMKSLTMPVDPFWKFVSTIKSAVDPNRILSPGRYNVE